MSERGYKMTAGSKYYVCMQKEGRGCKAMVEWNTHVGRVWADPCDWE